MLKEWEMEGGMVCRFLLLSSLVVCSEPSPERSEDMNFFTGNDELDALT